MRGRRRGRYGGGNGNRSRCAARGGTNGLSVVRRSVAQSGMSVVRRSAAQSGMSVVRRLAAQSGGSQGGRRWERRRENSQRRVYCREVAWRGKEHPSTPPPLSASIVCTHSAEQSQPRASPRAQPIYIASGKPHNPSTLGLDRVTGHDGWGHDKFAIEQSLENRTPFFNRPKKLLCFLTTKALRVFGCCPPPRFGDVPRQSAY